MIKKALKIAKLYFLESDDRLMAWLLLLGMVLATIGMVGFIACFAWWTAAFWAALAAMHIQLFLWQLVIYAGLAAGMLVCHYINQRCMALLQIRWREWFTLYLVGRYLSDSAADIQATQHDFLDITRTPEQLTNPEHRIQSDVKKYVYETLVIGQGLLFSILQFSSSVGMLWVISGTMGFSVAGLIVIIPGFLVWAAILFSLVATLLVRYFGKGLAQKNLELETKEAQLRQELENIRQKSESIAIERGQKYYEDLLNKTLDEITCTSNQKAITEARVTAFRDFYQNFASIFPYLIASPMYFSGRVDLAIFMQIGFSFSQVNSSMDWFVETYELIAAYKASVERLDALNNAFDKNGLETSEKSIEYRVVDDHQITLDNIIIYYPNKENRVLLKNTSLTISPGEHTLIEGENGCGKSTLLKVMAGTWRYGSGRVKCPQNSMFFSQKPTIPTGSLRDVLAYPKSANTYTDEAYHSALNKVGLNSFISNLGDASENRCLTLSEGEKQKIGFARVLLIRPTWLFLDEATASLTTENEKALYQLLKEELPNTTLISIGHRPDIKQYHNQLLFFGKDGVQKNNIESNRNQMNERGEEDAYSFAS